MSGRFVIAWVAGALLVVIVASVLRVEMPGTVYTPFSSRPLPELCSFRRLFGRECPGCGLTRSFVLAANFRFAEAWQVHATGTLVFISLVASIPWRIALFLLNRAGRTVQSTVRLELGWLSVLVFFMMFQWCIKSLS